MGCFLGVTVDALPTNCPLSPPFAICPSRRYSELETRVRQPKPLIQAGTDPSLPAPAAVLSLFVGLGC
jgi:hypothetical protein